MRSVVVASGKGGTGKTTMTAAFARIAARARRVALADCDVEASNLPLAFEVRDVACDDFEGGAVATIDPALCAQCGNCEAACVFGAIAQGDAGTTVEPLACEGCGRCASACPSGAIAMNTRSVGSACSGASAAGTIAFGQLSPGQDLSGRLVTEVRRRAALQAEESDADLLLVDGPPGVGCPLIAAMASTDLLVAVAEPSVSGVHDLMRLVQLAARMNARVAVVLNKADLSAEGARHVREACAEREVPLVAEVPFEPGIARYLTRLAGGEDPDGMLATAAGAQIERAWGAVEGLLSAAEARQAEA